MSETSPPGPLLVDIEGKALSDDDRCLLLDPAVGGVILFTRNYEAPRQLAALTTEIRRLRSNLLVVADQEGGRVQRFREGFTAIPPMRALGRFFDTAPEDACEAASDLGWLLASELRCQGVDLPLAPVVDLDLGLSEVIGSRAFARTVRATSDLARAFVRGLAEAGSAATIKHFPGHGAVAADSHAELPVDNRPLADLEHDWRPFAMLAAEGVASVMMAHVRFPAVDDRPASFSSRWIKDILRSRLGFPGCVFCDDLSMAGAAVLGDHAERTRLALAAGCDYLPVCNDRDAAELACMTVKAGVDDQGLARREALLRTIESARNSAIVVDDNIRWQRARAVAERLAADFGDVRGGGWES